MGGKVRLDRGAARRVDRAVDEGLEFVRAQALAVRHFILVTAAGPSPSSKPRKRSRPRDSRDMTVPMGTPSTRAASA